MTVTSAPNPEGPRPARFDRLLHLQAYVYQLPEELTPDQYQEQILADLTSLTKIHETDPEQSFSLIMLTERVIEAGRKA